MNPFIQNTQIEEMYPMDYEQMAQEDAMFPWLASDCMGDIMDDDVSYDDFSVGSFPDFDNDF
jgi:hypothetical protein